MVLEFTEKVVKIIKNIPKGQVLSYGMIASLAGNPRGARQVVRILHTQSRKNNLPWYRVVNSKGKISLKDPINYDEQKYLLEFEGIIFSNDDKIDFDKYFWKIESIE